MRLLPLSKSKYAVFLKCPWKAHALKNLGFQETTTLAAEQGIEAHAHLANILSGLTTVDDALQACSSEDVKYFVRQGLKLNPIRNHSNALLEKTISINKKGNPTDNIHKAIAHGILDVIDPDPEEDTLYVYDWKTGKWEYDSVFERNLYAGVLAHAMFPHLKKIKFSLIFLRSEHFVTSEYIFSNKDKEVTIVGPTGELELLSSNKNPILEWLSTILRKIKTTPAKPNPGSHCLNWYGAPCAFHGAECPLSDKLPATTNDLLPDYQDFKRAFFLLKETPDAISDSHIVALGYFAATQLESAAKAVKNNVEAWATRNGSFMVGDSEFGWHNIEVNEVDKISALQQMLESNISIEDIANAINISKTSLSRIPKRLYPGLRDSIIASTVTTTTKHRFGPIKKGESK